MRRLLLLALLAAAAAPASAQTATLRGFVTDATNGQPLIGANVALWPPDDPAAIKGAATDVDGLYVVVGLAPGTYVLRASSIGYESVVDTLRLAAETRQLDLALAPGAQTLGEATVESERTAGSANVDAGFQRIRVEDVQAIPAPDVSNDLVNYLVSLPGIVSSGDRGGQLFIRGGEPSQNQVFLDGIPVFQPFHVLGFYSAFPGDLLQNADVYAGGFDGRYGGQLSSVLDVTARTGNLRRFTASSSVAPFVASVSAEGPLARDKVSLLASGRLSTVDPIATSYIDADLPFRFGDAFGKLYYTPTATSRFSMTGLYTFDEGGIGQPEAARADEVRYQNRAAGFRYVFLPSSAPFRADISLSYSDLASELGASDRQREVLTARAEADDEPLVLPDERTVSLGRFSAEFNLQNLFTGFGIHHGGFLRRTFVSSELGGLFQNVETSDREALEAGWYVQPEVRWGGLTVSPGVRWTINWGLVEPRLRASWEGGPHRLSVAAGRYHQPIVGISDRRDATSVFTAYAVAPKDAIPEADHLVGGYRLRPAPWADVSLEGFYKRMRNLAVAEWTAVPRLTTQLQPAEGEAYGADVRAEVRPGRTLFSINYGLSFVEYASTNARNALWYGSETLRFRPPHDRRHQVTVVASAPVAGFNASVRWQYGSGLPFSRALGFDVFLLPESSPSVTTQPGQARVIYERPFNALLPSYHRLDVSVDRDFDLGWGTVTTQVGLINAYDRRNLFAYDIFTLERSDQLPVIPTFGLRVATN